MTLKKILNSIKQLKRKLIFETTLTETADTVDLMTQLKDGIYEIYVEGFLPPNTGISVEGITANKYEFLATNIEKNGTTLKTQQWASSNDNALLPISSWNKITYSQISKGNIEIRNNTLILTGMHQSIGDNYSNQTIYTGRCELDSLNHKLFLTRASGSLQSGTKIRIYKISE